MLLTDACNESIRGILLQVNNDKPLQLIYGIKSKPSARIERWQLRLQPYNFNIIYRKGLENIPNFVSRIKSLPPPISKKDKTEDFINFITVNAVLKTITLEEIKNETEKDMELVRLKNNSYRQLNTANIKNLEQISL